jgi:tRNA nucleotidyltransferase (CCA-adding enzyme)
MIKLPKEALIVLNELEKNNFEAFLVGGFVRDLLLNRPTHDIDCATNALPDEIERVFKFYKQSAIGRDHGTIGVKVNDVWIEITTYRIDDVTKDHRHPKSVKFTPSLKEDVLRRDFTINALAINLKLELYDYVQGQIDIENKVIRCVGNPEKRFYEDSLRILRAIRFACQLGFEIEENSLREMHKHRLLISTLAVERVYQEFKLILESDLIYKSLNLTKEIIHVFLPEILSVPERNLSRIDQLKPFLQRFSLFFIDKNEEILRTRCMALKMPNKVIKDCLDFHVCFNHSYDIQLIDIKRMMQSFPSEIIVQAMEMQRILESDRFNEDSYTTLLKLIEDKVVISVKGLAIDGHDLIKLNYKGKSIQEKLNQCLEAVMMNKVENTKEALLNWVNLT